MIEVHGHRGSRGTHPENTLASFEEAYASGAQAFEIDTQPTEDGVVTVFHDFEISYRVCLRSGIAPDRALRVVETPWEEMRTWDVGQVLQPKFTNQKLSPQRIMTLEDTLSWLMKKPASFRINIEMKVNPQWRDGFVERYTNNVVNALKKYGADRRCLLQSFDTRALTFARKAMPSLAISVLFDRPCDFVKEAVRLKANAIGPDYTLLTEEIIKRAKANRIKVIPYTVNEKGDWDRLIKWGVDGIITDFPRELVKFIGGSERAPGI